MKLKIISGILATLLVSQSYADAPTCHTTSSVPYCQYLGTVEKVYVNADNWILVYFDTPLDLSLPTNVGISGVTQSDAAIVMIDSNPTFAQYFYSAILAAQASGRRIGIQMRASSGAYLIVDRIWVFK